MKTLQFRKFEALSYFHISYSVNLPRENEFVSLLNTHTKEVSKYKVLGTVKSPTVADVWIVYVEKL